MIHFLKITIQEKGSDDYRAFLDWADSETMTVYQLRGYGSTPGAAADDAYGKFADEESRDDFISDYWDWNGISGWQFPTMAV